MIFSHVSLIQEGESCLFYRFDRELNGYMIAGVFVAPTLSAKMQFAKMWKYFVSEVVRADDVYCSIMLGDKNSLFENYLDYHVTINGCKIYKIDNYVRDQHSSFIKQKERAKIRLDQFRSGRLNKKQNTDHRGKPLS
jgi:hypothetical protein